MFLCEKARQMTRSTEVFPKNQQNQPRPPKISGVRSRQPIITGGLDFNVTRATLARV